MGLSVAERYVQLGLRLGRHADGIVDAYSGPPELAAAVAAEVPTDPRVLAADAQALLDELDDGWLRDQTLALRTCAGALAGEVIPYADEVERCHGVRPTHTDEAIFAAAHERVDDLLPGDGPLADRYGRWRDAMRVPPERVAATVSAVVEEARAWTRGLVELPDGERVDVEIVRDRPWMGYCEYLGGLRSRIMINVDLPVSAIELLQLAIHETYPGHHAERVLKDRLLVGERGLLEETLVLVPTPQSLVSEGIAELAPAMLRTGDAGPSVAAVVQDAGVGFDLDHALAVEHALEACRWAEVNAALMVHADGASEAAARAYLERWALLTPALAAHVVRFLTEPTSRTYLITYAAGRKLCRAFVAGDPARFRALLTEQVRVADLRSTR